MNFLEYNERRKNKRWEDLSDAEREKLKFPQKDTWCENYITNISTSRMESYFRSLNISEKKKAFKFYKKDSYKTALLVKYLDEQELPHFLTVLKKHLSTLSTFDKEYAIETLVIHKKIPFYHLLEYPQRFCKHITADIYQSEKANIDRKVQFELFTYDLWTVCDTLSRFDDVYKKIIEKERAKMIEYLAQYFTKDYPGHHEHLALPFHYVKKELPINNRLFWARYLLKNLSNKIKLFEIYEELIAIVPELKSPIDDAFNTYFLDKEKNAYDRFMDTLIQLFPDHITPALNRELESIHNIIDVTISDEDRFQKLKDRIFNINPLPTEEMNIIF